MGRPNFKPRIQRVLAVLSCDTWLDICDVQRKSRLNFGEVRYYLGYLHSHGFVDSSKPTKRTPTLWKLKRDGYPIKDIW